MRKLFFISLVLLAGMFGSCKDDCVTCTGMSAPREFCPDDYQEKSDFQNDVAAYEATGGQCE